MTTSTQMACSERLVPTAGLRMHYHQCTRKAIVERDGKWWCKIHDPVYQKQKADERQKAYEKRVEAQYSPYKKIEELKATLAAQRTALLALAERIRREGMQGVANSIEEIVKP